jgi:N-acetylneuraminic acid mutarotase
MISRFFGSLPNSVSTKVTAAYFTCKTKDIEFTEKVIVEMFISDNSWKNNGIRGCHSYSASVDMADMSIRILPALSDNYMVSNFSSYK